MEDVQSEIRERVGRLHKEGKPIDASKLATDLRRTHRRYDEAMLVQLILSEVAAIGGNASWMTPKA